jgi:ankyrin repeat protein
MLTGRNQEKGENTHLRECGAAMKNLLVLVVLTLLMTIPSSADLYSHRVEAARIYEAAKVRALLVEAVRKNDAAGVRALLDENPNLYSDSHRVDISYLLLSAVQNGNLEIAEILVSHGADANAMGYYGRSPLHLAASSGNVEMAKLLVSKGANINTKGENGAPPLLTTIVLMSRAGFSERGCREREKLKAVAVFLISKGADVNAVNKNDETALHFAAMAHDRELVTLLVSHGARVNFRNKAGETPLHQAAMAGDRDTTFRLMAKGGDLFLKNNYGVSPFSLMLLQFHTSPEGPFLELCAVTAFFLGIALIVFIRVRLRQRATLAASRQAAPIDCP